jgi:hypothetical protein
MASATQLLKFFKLSVTVTLVFRIVIFGTLFLLLSLSLINIPNILSVISSNYPLFSKLRILSVIITGAFYTISGIDFVLLLIISVLFGANFAFVIEKFNFIRKQHNLRLTIGSGIISLASAGCASCGLSLVSLVGLGSALAILPFRGVELYLLAIAVLLASFLYNLNSIYKACNV